MHELRIDSVDLVGGGRHVDFNQGLSIVQGTITTGKSTFVRLLRALLGSVPTGLPPETASIRALRATILIEGQPWDVYRPLVTTDSAIVEIVSADDEDLGEVHRLPVKAATRGEETTYFKWLLERLRLPAVAVPRARSDETSDLTPVTINDWLAYCIVTDDEIDTSVFGHKIFFRDHKRRTIFELVYGLFDAEMARLQVALRSVSLRIEALESEVEIAKRFLEGTPFADPGAISDQIAQREAALATLELATTDIAQRAVRDSEADELRSAAVAADERASQLQASLARTRAQVDELQALLITLNAQRRRLTRAITAGEWLVDYDFVVCPRCGQDVNANRTALDNCYLCLQHVDTDAPVGDSLIAEQDRVVAQIGETEDLVSARLRDTVEIEDALDELSAVRARVHRELNFALASFVSSDAGDITRRASERAALIADLARLRDYLQVLERFRSTDEERQSLWDERDRLIEELEQRANAATAAEGLIKQLEARLFSYLERLDIPSFDEVGITASIDRNRYLPIVNGRTFEELSSQGLEVLVNAAHALAHHTVAIDNALPLPGLLVLDGLSSNVGHAGVDRERVNELYRLLIDVSAQYQGRLQIIASDNDVPDFASSLVVLELSDDDRLVRTVGADDGPAQDDPESTRDSDGDESDSEEDLDA